MTFIALWSVFETSFSARNDYPHPFTDVSLNVTFVSPGGRTHCCAGFWDGGHTWRVRFSPDEEGQWQWKSSCSPNGDPGLHARVGEFLCTPVERPDRFSHGPVNVSPDGYTLSHADGTPFFWLGDTAWNGVLRSRPEDWDRYLEQRSSQGFTAIQFVSHHWRGGNQVLGGRKAWTEAGTFQVIPEFFQAMDAKIAAIDRAGMLAVPVMLWAVNSREAGYSLPETDALAYAKYLKARWGAYHVCWILGGDADYDKDPERWKRLGRAVFADPHRDLATQHPCGQNWSIEHFRDEPWFSFIGYQSGHGDSPAHLRWLTSGPPAKNWNRIPVKPIINLEPNYEIHPAYHSNRLFGAKEVRRAACWSLLRSPAAGVTFGHNSIWFWPEREEAAEAHGNIPSVPPWYEGLNSPGVQAMSLLRGFFADLPWWTLRPADHLLREQAPEPAPERFIAAASDEAASVFVAYTPEGDRVCLNPLSSPPLSVRWFNPRNGSYLRADIPESGTPLSFQPPSNEDWLLVITCRS